MSILKKWGMLSLIWNICWSFATFIEGINWIAHFTIAATNFFCHNNQISFIPLCSGNFYLSRLLGCLTSWTNPQAWSASEVLDKHSFRTWPSVAARVQSLQGCLFAATRSDKYGVLQSWIHEQFYNRPHSFFITWHDYYRQIEECRV